MHNVFIQFPTVSIRYRLPELIVNKYLIGFSTITDQSFRYFSTWNQTINIGNRPTVHNEFIHNDVFNCVTSVQFESKNPTPWNFLTFFANNLEFLVQNFTCLLYIPIYAGLQIIIQLSATLMKLCRIKRDHHYMLKMSTIGRNARWVVTLNMA